MLTEQGNLLTMKMEARMRYISSFIIIALVLLLSPSFARAEVKEIIAEGTYNMGDGETPSVAESRALLNAKQTALEQAGTYVESYIKVENIQLTKDEIQVLSSGIMEVEVLDKKRTVVGDGIHFWVKINAKIALDKIEDMAKRVKEKSIVEDYKKVQEAYAKSEKEIEVLKKQLADAKGEKQKKQVEAKITDEERLLQANEWFDKGNRHYLNKEYDYALEAYTSAIALYPNSNYATIITLINRGNVYADKGQYDRAIEDYNKAIALDPNDAGAYISRGNAYVANGQYDLAIEDHIKATAISTNLMATQGLLTFVLTDNGLVLVENKTLQPAEPYLSGGNGDTDSGRFIFEDAEHYNRGIAYFMKKQYDLAIEDYNKAIAINPNLADAYNNRGIAYFDKGQYDRAIEDYNKAIAINQNLAFPYVSRGVAYVAKGQYDRAIEDYNKAIAINPNAIMLYFSRGIAYVAKGQYDRAIEDYNKAIAINPNLAMAYISRGVAYVKKGQYGRAISDFQKACDMGNKNGCETLQRALKNR